MALDRSPNFVVLRILVRGAIKRLSRAKRKHKLVAYAPFIKMWMNPDRAARDA
jgi:hypothetical protein